MMFDEKKADFDYSVFNKEEAAMREDLYLIQELFKNQGFLRLLKYLENGREEILESLKRLSRESTDERVIARHAAIFNGYDTALSMPEYVVKMLEYNIQSLRKEEDDAGS